MFKIRSCFVYFLPVSTRTPYTFGTQILKEVTCVRVRLLLENETGDTTEGWGETPLSVQWAWPGGENPVDRFEAMKALCLRIGRAFVDFGQSVHPIEFGVSFQKEVFTELRQSWRESSVGEIPYLAGLVCLSAFDIAVHDAFGRLHGLSSFAVLDDRFMKGDLSRYIESETVDFAGSYPSSFLRLPRQTDLPAWHSVGVSDPLTLDELDGSEPEDGYPNDLESWIRRDGIKCLKIKLSGRSYEEDLDRILRIGALADELSCDWMCADFNCTVAEVSFVSEMLRELLERAPRTFARILYVEQPFAYEMSDSPADVRAASALKPLFMDESAHDWKLVREGRRRGWTGVALKACKTYTSAFLMQAWAKAHGMPIMVQDLTNPMLAQIGHAQLAAHADCIMGLETNSMQFYPDASIPEAKIHPGVFRRNKGLLNLDTVTGAGVGYRVDEIERSLPNPEGVYEK